VDAGGSSLRFSRVIVPMLRESGLTEGEIDALLIDNPRRYFAGEPVRFPRGYTPSDFVSLAEGLR